MYKIELDVTNYTNEIIMVTTKDFKVKDVASNKYLSSEVVNKMFPPDENTGDYIILARLMPISSSNLIGEQLKLSCEFDIGTARENSCWNVASTCVFNNGN